MNEGNHIDAPWRDLTGQLYRHFEVTAQHRCLLWVDSAQADPFKGDGIAEQLRVRVPIRHPRFDMSRAPYVVPLDLSRSGHADLFETSVELAWLSWSTQYLSAMQGQPICGWVRTAATAKTVARHWGANCHLHTSRRQHRLLRFQDPGVREWCWPILDRTQQQAMLGPALEIVSIRRDQQLIHHGPTEAAKSSASASKDALDTFSKLHIEQIQWEQIDDYAALHAAWLTWRCATANRAAVVQDAGWERPILRALAQAAHLGIRDVADRELFAFHALQWGPNFFRNPKLDHVWPKTQAGEFYGSAVESVLGFSADQLAL